MSRISDVPIGLTVAFTVIMAVAAAMLLYVAVVPAGVRPRLWFWKPRNRLRLARARRHEPRNR